MRVEILSQVFQQLHLRIIEKCNELLKKKGKSLTANIGPERYGYFDHDGSKEGITYLIASDDKVLEFLRLYYKGKQKSGKKINIKNADTALDRIGERYLYGKQLEASKNLGTVKLKGQYCLLFIKFLGYDSWDDFLDAEEDNLPLQLIRQQRQLLAPKIGSEYLQGEIATFVTYYFSYLDNKIKKFILEISPFSGKAVQTGFHFRESSQDIRTREVFIDSATMYKGTVSPSGKNGLAVVLKGKENDATNHMSILLYQGGMPLLDATLLRGHLQTMSAHGYIFSGEIFLLREKDIVQKDRLLAPAYDQKEEVKYIHRYLFLQRRTSRVPQSLVQKVEAITAKGKPLKILQSMVGTWKFWGVYKGGKIAQAKMVVEDDYSAYLYIHSQKGKERQVCTFSVSDDRNGYNLWVMAHEQFGAELKNVAFFEIPSEFSNREKPLVWTQGVACNVGVNKSDFGITRIVLMKMRDNSVDFNPCILGVGDLSLALEDSIHKKAYKYLYKRKEEDCKKMLKSLEEVNRSKGQLGNTNNAGYE